MGLIGRFWNGLTTKGKIAVTGVSAVAAYTLLKPGTANAQSAPGTLGPASAALGAGALVMLPGSFHLRPTATAASTGPNLPAQRVRVTGPALLNVNRGPNETMYPVALDDGRTGFVFIPTNATRV